SGSGGSGGGATTGSTASSSTSSTSSSSSSSGAPCAPCAFGSPCTQDSDCASGFCSTAISTCDARTLATSQLAAPAIAIDATNLYWGIPDSAIATGTIMKMPLAGGTPTAIVSAQGAIVALAVDADGVYWSSNNGIILTAPLSGSNPTQLAADVARGLALDAES